MDTEKAPPGTPGLEYLFIVAYWTINGALLITCALFLCLLITWLLF